MAFQETNPLPKSLTGIKGLDEITFGGLPKRRTTLLCGGAGCGKTLFGLEFLIRGAVDHGEPGVYIAFEESSEDLIQNVASLGFDLVALASQKKVLIDHIKLDDVAFVDTGEYDLNALFIRLGYAIDSIGAKRVVLDSIESLFTALPNEFIVRREMRQLFTWLKDKGVTSIITGEQGRDTLTRFGIEEYVSDCVIALDHRVVQQVSTRRLRILKYRGSMHGTNEYPFLIGERGINVLPITSLGLAHVACDERISIGIERLDNMMGGDGVFRGSSILISGTAGCGKTSVASSFAHAACQRGERCLTFLFEESPSQLVRNMKSIGIDFEPFVKQGTLHFHAARPSLHGLEMHLAVMQQLVEEHNPSIVIIDPISSFSALGNALEIRTMLVRLIDFLKVKNITTMLTSLTNPESAMEKTEQEISSLIDTWLLLRDIESNGERNRGLYILKSRGMSHSNQIREFNLTGRGVELSNVYVGPMGVLTGSARQAQEAIEAAEQLRAKNDIERQKLAIERKREALESRIAALRAEFAADETEAHRDIRIEELREGQLQQERSNMFVRRGGDD